MQELLSTKTLQAKLKEILDDNGPCLTLAEVRETHVISTRAKSQLKNQLPKILADVSSKDNAKDGLLVVLKKLTDIVSSLFGSQPLKVANLLHQLATNQQDVGYIEALSQHVNLLGDLITLFPDMDKLEAFLRSRSLYMRGLVDMVVPADGTDSELLGNVQKTLVSMTLFMEMRPPLSYKKRFSIMWSFN